jgi:hypothetical protein
MGRILNFLKGKKTYLAAGLLAALGVWTVLHGQADLGLYMIVSAAGFVGLGDRANRHQTQILSMIQAGAHVASDIRAKRAPSAAEVADFLKSNEPAIKAVLSKTVQLDPCGADAPYLRGEPLNLSDEERANLPRLEQPNNPSVQGETK